jgi:hypothetical protein
MGRRAVVREGPGIHRNPNVTIPLPRAVVQTRAALAWPRAPRPRFWPTAGRAGLRPLAFSAPVATIAFIAVEVREEHVDARARSKRQP